MVKYLARYYFRATLSREISPPARRCPDLEPFLRPLLPLHPAFPAQGFLTTPSHAPRVRCKPFPLSLFRILSVATGVYPSAAPPTPLQWRRGDDFKLKGRQK
jgi:hypothetical protein